MLANNETGVLQPVEEIGEITRTGGAFFHIDAVQGAGKVNIDVRRFGCHLATISAHKMHGPRASAQCLCAAELPRAAAGGGSHERRQRAGTENVPGIVGFAKAADWPCNRSKMEPFHGWPHCATGWKRDFCGFPAPASTGR